MKILQELIDKWEKDVVELTPVSGGTELIVATIQGCIRELRKAILEQTQSELVSATVSLKTLTLLPPPHE